MLPSSVAMWARQDQIYAQRLVSLVSQFRQLASTQLTKLGLLSNGSLRKAARDADGRLWVVRQTGDDRE